MSCTGRRDEALFRAADVLETSEREAFDAHVAGGCASCRAALTEAEELLSRLPLALGPREPSTHVRARLLERAGLPEARAANRRRVSLATAMAASLLAAVLSGSVVAGLLARANGGEREVLEERIAALEAELEEWARHADAEQSEADAEIVRLEARLDTAHDVIAVFEDPNSVAVALAPRDASSEARARMVWDYDDYLCYLRVSGLEPAPEPARYALWLTNARGAVFRPEDFEVDARGEGVLLALLPRDFGQVVRAEITLEPMEPGERPHGAVVLEVDAS